MLQGESTVGDLWSVEVFQYSRLLLGGLDETGEALEQSLAVLVGGMLFKTRFGSSQGKVHTRC